jgi:oligoendopeptidase F
MPQNTLLESGLVSTEDRWELESIFESVEHWKREYGALEAVIPQLASFAGRLRESSKTLLSFLELKAGIEARVYRLKSYPKLRYYADAKDQDARIMLDQAENLAACFDSTAAFFAPEVLEAPPGFFEDMVKRHEGLHRYQHLFSTIERERQHTLSLELETQLQIFAPLLGNPESVRTALNELDLTIAPVEVEGRSYQVSHGELDALLSNPSREVRRKAFNAYADAYQSLSNTYTESLIAQVKTSLAFSRARNFTSTFEATMFRDALPERVFDTVLNSCRAHRQLFQRYFKARAAVLKIEKVTEYDLMAPLTRSAPSFPYQRAQELVLGALGPLGEEYLRIVRRGLYEERWVDWKPRPNKYSNAFSSGAYGTRPFLLLNYAPNMTEVGTLAHELGHSMHSYLTNRTQPVCYSNYAMSVAETASNLNQVLLRAEILKTADRDTTLAVLEEAFFFAHRYLFLMPTMSEVEHKLHSTYASDGAMSASQLATLTVEAYREAYGDCVDTDSDRLGVKWAQFCHFYSPYYFFQYAIGISAAMLIGQRLLAGEAGLRDKYLAFLSAGSSKYPVELFELIDIDITSHEFFREAFKVVEGYVIKLEEISKLL